MTSSFDFPGLSGDEIADAFEDYEPRPGDDGAPLPPAIAGFLSQWRREIDSQR